jgi:hypothetical protein
VAETLPQASIDATWDAWERIACPVLVVHATSALTAESTKEMMDQFGSKVLTKGVAGAIDPLAST